MNVEKDKAEPLEFEGKPAAKTVVGVPAIPLDRPSDAALTHELPAQGEDDDEQPTAIDMKAVTTADAEHVLSDRPPGVAGALAPRPPGAAVIKTPPLSGEMFRGLPRPAVEPKTRAGVAPQPGVATRGRSTLLLDGSAPPAAPSDSSVDNPPIVVPVSGATPPKAVTQPPPWGEGAAHAANGMPHLRAPIREPAPSVEEISGSMLLPADASSDLLAASAEELSGSVLIEDAPGGQGGPPLVTRAVPTALSLRPTSVKPPVPKSSVPPKAAPSAKPPVPRSSPSSRPPESAHRALFGMPELPAATPGPNLEAIHAATNAARAPSVPPPLSHGFDPHAIPPPPAFDPPAAGAAGPWVPPPLVTQPLPTLVASHAPRFDAQGMPVEVPTLPPPALEPPPQTVVSGLPAIQSAYAPQMGAAGGPPSGAPMTGDIELTRLPRSPFEQGIDRARRELRKLIAWLEAQNLLRPGTRPQWFLPAVALGGLIVGIGLVGLMVSVVRGTKPGDDDVKTAASGQASATASSISLAPPVTSAAATPALPVSAACTLLGTPHVIGPSATVAAGVEVTVSGGDIALGFAPDDHDAMGVRIDPAELTVGTTTRAHSRDAVRRATPILNKGSLSLAVDTDHKGDKLQGRRTIRSAPPVQIGATADGQLSWTKVGTSSPVPLWALSGPGIDALRGSVDGFGDPTIAVAFRAGGAVWMGTVAGTGGLAPVGPLSHVDGLSTTIGSPAVAISSSVVLVAWADRVSNDAPWKLRWTRFAAGSPPEPPADFVPPDGGKGEPFMSPALAPVPGGRFLLVWTEGPASGHVVRALTLGPDGTRLGPPLELSPEGANAGQAQAAVTANGDGVVAFLQSGGKGFEVAAASVHCAVP